MNWVITTSNTLSGVLLAKLWLDRLIIWARITVATISLRGTGLGVRSSRAIMETLGAILVSTAIYLLLIHGKEEISLSAIGVTQFDLRLSGRWMSALAAIGAIITVAHAVGMRRICRRLNEETRYATVLWLTHPLFSSSLFYVQRRRPGIWLATEVSALLRKFFPLVADAIVGALAANTAADAGDVLDFRTDAKATSWKDLDDSTQERHILLTAARTQEIGGNARPHVVDPTIFVMIRAVVFGLCAGCLGYWWSSRLREDPLISDTRNTLSILQRQFSTLVIVASVAAVLAFVIIAIGPLYRLTSPRIYLAGALAMLTAFGPTLSLSVREWEVETANSRYRTGPLSASYARNYTNWDACTYLRHSTIVVDGSYWSYVLTEGGYSDCSVVHVKTFKGYEEQASWPLPGDITAFASYGTASGIVVVGPRTQATSPLIGYSQVTGKERWRWTCPRNLILDGTGFDSYIQSSDTTVKAFCLVPDDWDGAYYSYDVNIATGKSHFNGKDDQT